MQEFLDANGKRVQLSFRRNAFPLKAKHVLVICRYLGKWLLTNHKERGLEFPGGKIERDESIEKAARREVYEETGGIVKELHFIGEYFVAEEFVKAIVYAEVSSIEERAHYYETKGPIIKEGELIDELDKPEFSFIMKDQVVPLVLKKLKEGKSSHSYFQ